MADFEPRNKKIIELIDEYAQVYGAVGAALSLVDEQQKNDIEPEVFSTINDIFIESKKNDTTLYPALELKLSDYPDFASFNSYVFEDVETDFVDVSDIDDLEDVEELQMEGDLMNLEIPIIDAIILALSVNPLCDEECMGLCPDCGEKWESLPDDHSHEVVDARWSGLASLLEKPADFGNQEK